jgi:hypothetical protein
MLNTALMDLEPGTDVLLHVDFSLYNNYINQLLWSDE